MAKWAFIYLLNIHNTLDESARSAKEVANSILIEMISAGSMAFIITFGQRLCENFSFQKEC